MSNKMNMENSKKFAGKCIDLSKNTKPCGEIGHSLREILESRREYKDMLTKKMSRLSKILDMCAPELHAQK